MALCLAACAAAPPAVHLDPLLRNQIVLDALGQVGRPYRYGGTSPDGFDCSGLVQYVFAQSGISLPRTTTEQHVAGTRVDLDELEPGDLLFYRFDAGKVDHVAIYLGDGEAIHAPSAGRSVIVASVDLPYWRKHFVDAVRVLANARPVPDMAARPAARLPDSGPPDLTGSDLQDADDMVRR